MKIPAHRCCLCYHRPGTINTIPSDVQDNERTEHGLRVEREPPQSVEVRCVHCTKNNPRLVQSEQRILWCLSAPDPRLIQFARTLAHDRGVPAALVVLLPSLPT